MISKSEMIPIPKNKIDLVKNMENKYNYNYNIDLKKNFFDPTKGSPPNDFMNKLNIRMGIYESKFILSSSPVISCIQLNN